VGVPTRPKTLAFRVDGQLWSPAIDVDAFLASKRVKKIVYAIRPKFCMFACRHKASVVSKIYGKLK